MCCVLAYDSFLHSKNNASFYTTTVLIVVNILRVTFQFCDLVSTMLFVIKCVLIHYRRSENENGFLLFFGGIRDMHLILGNKRQPAALITAS